MSHEVIEAPAKVNLALFVGPDRGDGRHEIASILAPLGLTDSLVVAEADGGDDEVICEGIEGPELTAAALMAVRARGLELPPLRVVVTKRTPVAAGLGGGSADAAALLGWIARRLGPDAVGGLASIAAELGSDVLAQSGLWAAQPGPAPCLVTGGGERVDGLLAPPPALDVVLAPAPAGEGLSAAEVYARAEALEIPRSADEIASLAARLRDLGDSLPLEADSLAVNDLQPAAVSLRPALSGVLESMEAAGAQRAMVSGSGPTVVGFVAPGDDATAIAAEFARRRPGDVAPIVSAMRVGGGPG